MTLKAGFFGQTTLKKPASLSGANPLIGLPTEWRRLTSQAANNVVEQNSRGFPQKSWRRGRDAFVLLPISAE
jgi:hypothetical protein